MRLAAALAKLCEEDRALSFVQDAEMSEMKLYGQGEMHLRVTTERLADRFGVTIQTQKPTVAYRETIRDAVTVRGRHKKQSGGHGQFGDVVVEVAPRGRGEGFAFAERVHGGSVPRQYFSSVEAGAKDALARGPLGFPVVDVSVTLIDGSYHTVDSSDMAFRAAARIALDEALPKARPVLLEPILCGDDLRAVRRARARERAGQRAARPDPRLRGARGAGTAGRRCGRSFPKRRSAISSSNCARRPRASAPSRPNSTIWPNSSGKNGRPGDRGPEARERDG